MSEAGEELNQIAVELEHHALQFPRPLAALVLAVAAARIACDAPAAEWDRIATCHWRSWDGTVAEYAARERSGGPTRRDHSPAGMAGEAP